MVDGYYIGLMSGTSLDGIDAAVIHIENQQYKLCSSLEYKWPQNLATRIKQLIEENDSLNETLELDQLCAQHFAKAALDCLTKAGLKPSQVVAIGSHGQTIRHKPKGNETYSLQIGNPSNITELTEITTVADFRNRDIAAAGQGAPLAPAFHQAAFHHPKKQRVIVNIGGIANITLLNKNQDIIGYDTGPGNRLLDDWIFKTQQSKFDLDGKFAASGKIIPELLQHLLNDPYFKLKAPKSTGTDYFNLTWLNNHLNSFQNEQPKDIQATLSALTATTITDQIKQITTSNAEVFICGGGFHNTFLTQLIDQQLPNASVGSTEILGIHPDWVEAMTFAWLAQQAISKLPGNIPSVTGAKGPRICGGIYFK